MKMSQGLLPVSLAACALTAGAFTFEDIHFWVGEGTNRCAVVVDWSGLYGSCEGNGGIPTSRVWGYRWNGETAPTLDALVQRIAAEDPRFAVGGSDSGWGFYLSFAGYDTADCHVRFDTAAETASDPSALIGSGACGLWWNVMFSEKGETFKREKASLTMSSVGMSFVQPADGEWWVLYYGLSDYDPVTWDMFPAEDAAEPYAAESPYGWKVTDYYTESETVLWGDDSGKPAYADPSAVLGRPRDFMSGDTWGAGLINPFNPEWQKGTLFSLDCLDGEMDLAFVTIAFDHPVVDDPMNPFGIDFIVFGNAMTVNVSGEYYYDGADPDTLRIQTDPSRAGSFENALVEVSADGRVWFAFRAGPYADSSMPTLGRVYDRANPDTSLFAGNQWWGERTNPLFPVDPSATFASCAGLTLGELCRRYNGSAGGTGYDISRFDLPKDEKGRKWFKYVRISSMDSGEVDDEGYPVWTQPEVDAVADVAPVSAYQAWVCGHFAWDTAYQDETYTDAAYEGEPFARNVTGIDALSANGVKNGVNAALGVAPDDPDPLAFTIGAFTVGESFATFDLFSKVPLDAAAPLIRIGGKERLADRRWTYETPFFEGSSRDEQTGLWRNTFRRSLADGSHFFNLSVSDW